MGKITFEGVPGGDCECFVWKVDTDNYIKVCGEKEYQDELAYCDRECLPQPKENARWSVYPSDVLKAAGFDMLQANYPKLRVTVIVEEIEDE